jgi:hypothetical protein
MIHFIIKVLTQLAKGNHFVQKYAQEYASISHTPSPLGVTCFLKFFWNSLKQFPEMGGLQQNPGQSAFLKIKHRWCEHNNTNEN